MDYRFEYADKSQMQTILPLCFDMLYANMNVIAPTGNTYAQDFEEWYANVFPAMQKDPRQIILMYKGETLVGYFQYYVVRQSFMMEEIQIVKAHQGTGLFRLFYTWLVSLLPKDIVTVEAYSHKYNFKSQGILETLGLVRCGENQNGNSFYYKGDYHNIVQKYT